jgi:uncharacterized protein YjaG (DUF416 family)
MVMISDRLIEKLVEVINKFDKRIDFLETRVHVLSVMACKCDQSADNYQDMVNGCPLHRDDDKGY